MVVPAEQSDENAHTVVHEYGHHLDRSTPVTGVREPNGTPVWWRARGMERLVRVSSVATSYVLGWERSIAEIFAEDYAQLALGDGNYNIGWLPSPDATVLAASSSISAWGLSPRSPRCRRSSRWRSLATAPLRRSSVSESPSACSGRAGA